MPLGNSKAEQELTSLLASTLVKREVLDPMGKIGWGHSTPPAPEAVTPVPGQPGSEGAPGQQAKPVTTQDSGLPAKPGAASPTQAQPATDTPDLIAQFEALRDPTTGLILNKYKDVPAAIKGVGHAVHMAKQSFSERDDALQRLAALQSENLTLRSTQPAPSTGAAPATPSTTLSRTSVDEAQARLDAVLSKITEEDGGVLNSETAKALSKAQREVADAAADLRVHETFASVRENQTKEQNEWNAVDAYMAEKYPAASRFADEVALFVQSNPLVAKAVNALMKEGDRVSATEFAWTEFERVHGAQVAAETQSKAEATEADLSAREQVRQEQLNAARRDAGVVQGSAGGAGVHENANAGGPSPEAIVAMRNRMKIEGEHPGSAAAAAWRKSVIGPSLDPALFGNF